MIKALLLLKARLKSRQVNANIHGHFGHGIKTPAIPLHYRDSVEVKTLQLSPAMPPPSPALRGAVFPMTGALTNIIIVDRENGTFNNDPAKWLSGIDQYF